MRLEFVVTCVPTSLSIATLLFFNMIVERSQMILRNQNIVRNQEQKKLHMAYAYAHHVASTVASTMDKKIKFHIFNGMGYEIWRYRLARTLAAEELKALLKESEDKKKYVALPEEERGTIMQDFDNKTEKGLAIIVQRLENRSIEIIRKFETVSQVLKALDRDFRVTTKVGLVTAKCKYRSMVFGGSGDLAKYLIKHEAAAQKVKESGEELTDEEKINQLHASTIELVDCYY